MPQTTLTLYELTHLIRQVIEDSFDHTYWVTAELSDVRCNRHCYMEFVEKDETGTEPLAKVRAQIWASRWSYLKHQFETATGMPLSDGMQVLAEVEVTFHEKYGFSLNIINLDPTYTLGDIARRRKEIIEKLKEEGIYDLNKSLELPALMNRIAVISASGAAGYQDFCQQLNNNPYNLRFEVGLFEAVMQGANVESSVVRALNQIYAQIEKWDAVVIIRGGGSTSDLRGFDTLLLAEHVAQFPLPIITGIGHERDNTVIDEVSHTRVKTPTAAAEFLIAHQYEQLMQLNNFEDCIVKYCQQMLTDAHNRLNRVTDKIPTLFTLRKEREQHILERMMTNMETAIRSHRVEQIATLQLLKETLRHTIRTFFIESHNRQTVIQTHIDSASPERLLKLGYSISRLNGKAVKDVKSLKAGDQIMTTVANGIFISTVNQAPPPDYDMEKRKSPFALDNDTYLA
mgnify:CR=1 FL=1